MRKLKEIKYLIPAIEIFVQNLKWKTHLSLWKDCIVALLYFFYSIYLGRIESLPLYFNFNLFTFFYTTQNMYNRSISFKVLFWSHPIYKWRYRQAIFNQCNGTLRSYNWFTLECRNIMKIYVMRHKWLRGGMISISREY